MMVGCERLRGRLVGFVRVVDGRFIEMNLSCVEWVYL